MKRRGVLAVLAVAAGLVAGLASPAHAAVAPVGMSLGLPGFNDMALDEARSKLFVSSGPAGSTVVVTSTTAVPTVTARIDNLPGASGLGFSSDRTRLFVALSTGDGIAAIDTATNTEVARYSTGVRSCPFDVITTGGNQVWFSYGCPGSLSGKIGYIDTSKPVATAVSFDAQDKVSFARPPLLSTPILGGMLFAAQPGTSSSKVVVFPFVSTNSSGATILVPRSASETAAGGLVDMVAGRNQDLYTAAGSRDRAEAFSTTDLSGRGAYAARPRPNALALNPAGDKLAVGALTGDNNDVHVYRTGTSSPLATHTLGVGETVAPRGLAYGAALDSLYVITFKDNQPQPSLAIVTLASTA